ncbi:MAG: hypothetical protein RMJ33_01310 [Saprospiraceae bacterium]|nr:hypothetical protein [Saprospiraceae bacterium]MDW8228448.1 hypothetical protein [Saprospiraceae bacterium]
MQKKALLSVSIVLAALWAACQRPVPSSRFSALAEAYCECTATLVQLNRATDTLDHKHLPQHFRQIETAYRQARDCMAAAIGQYGLLQTAELDSLTLLLQQRCPGVAHQRDLLEELLSK